MRLPRYAAAIAVVWSICCGVAAADELHDALMGLERAWARGMYLMPRSQQESYLAALEAKAHHVTERFPGRAEPLIWEGIIASTHASVQDFFLADATAQKARDVLLAAEQIDPDALDGFALATLGRLYYKVPSGISFGSRDKARAYLQRALKIDPNGLDQNFFYGEFLAGEGDTANAVVYLKKALAAPLRPGHEDSDAGCRADVLKLLNKLAR